jgi:hypothetical protein
VSAALGVRQEELLLMPYTSAIEKLNGRDVRLRVVSPPYPALGRGTLRVVRVAEEGDTVKLDVSYDDYERIV